MANTNYSTGVLELNLKQLKEILVSDNRMVQFYKKCKPSSDNSKSIESAEKRLSDTEGRIKDIEYSISILQGQVCLT